MRRNIKARFSTYLVSGFALTLFSIGAAANVGHYEEWTAAGGKINWSTGQVTAEGYGVPPPNSNTKAGPLLACRAAIVDAQRNLLEATQGVRVTAVSVIDNYMLASDEVKSSVEGIIKNARILARNPQPTGECKVVLGFQLAGQASKTIYRQLAKDNLSVYQPIVENLFGALIGKAYANDNQQQPTTQAPWSQAVIDINKRLGLLEDKLMQLQIDKASAPIKEDTNLLPTGLIVDARGSNFIPSLSPKIRELKGGIVYPLEKDKASDRFIDRGQLVSLFATDIEFAMSHPTVGARPLLVKALRTYGDTRTEIVLASEQAQRIERLDSTDFFDDAGVIIVLD